MPGPSSPHPSFMKLRAFKLKSCVPIVRSGRDLTALWTTCKTTVERGRFRAPSAKHTLQLTKSRCTRPTAINVQEPALTAKQAFKQFLSSRRDTTKNAWRCLWIVHLKKLDAHLGHLLQASRQEMCDHEKNGNHADILLQQIASLKKEIATLKKTVQGTSTFIGLVQPTYQHTWTVHPFMQLKRATSCGSHRTISSGVLHVNTPGYRIELLVDLNEGSEKRRTLGCSSSKTSRDSPAYLSLNFRLHPGEHDDLLPWPFANKCPFRSA